MEDQKAKHSSETHKFYETIQSSGVNKVEIKPLQLFRGTLGKREILIWLFCEKESWPKGQSYFQVFVSFLEFEKRNLSWLGKIVKKIVELSLNIYKRFEKTRFFLKTEK